MLFWIIALLLGLAVTAAVLVSVLRPRAPDDEGASDVAVYRDQLAEVDRDAARGVLTEDEAERMRVEVSRRLLAADKMERDEGGAPAPRWASIAAMGFGVVAILGGGVVVYDQIGAPGYPDLPLARRIAEADAARADRPAQQEAEAEAAARRMPDLPPDENFTQLMERLRAVVAERPDDLQGLRLLAQNEARMGNYAAAHEAARRIIEVQGDAATADDYVTYADLLILAAGGYVSPEAEAALSEALARDGTNETARYYIGLMYAQSGRYDLSFRAWAPLLDESAPSDPWVRPIRAQIEDVAARAGVNYDLPEAAPGPSREQMEAAEDMTAEERSQMIRGMVDGLSERLAAQGGPPEDWARLIRALGVLGETGRARAIWAEAQTVFAGAPDAVALIEEAAIAAGVAE